MRTVNATRLFGMWPRGKDCQTYVYKYITHYRWNALDWTWAIFQHGAYCVSLSLSVYIYIDTNIYIHTCMLLYYKYTAYTPIIDFIYPPYFGALDKLSEDRRTSECFSVWRPAKSGQSCQGAQLTRLMTASICSGCSGWIVMNCSYSSVSKLYDFPAVTALERPAGRERSEFAEIFTEQEWVHGVEIHLTSSLIY